MIRFLLLTMFVAGALCPARGTTLIEAGDFSDDPFDPVVFILTIGLNTVSGTLDEDDQDTFLFVVPPGESVTSQLVTEAGFGGDFETPRFVAFTCEFDLTVECQGSNVTPETALPFAFAGGEIREGISFRAPLSGDGCAGGCSYTAEVFVGEMPGEEVPEPTTWTLLATGLAGVMWRRRRATNRL